MGLGGGCSAAQALAPNRPSTLSELLFEIHTENLAGVRFVPVRVCKSATVAVGACVRLGNWATGTH